MDAEAEELGPLVLIDTAGCGMEEAADEDSDSKRNEGEAQVTSLGTEGHPHCLGIGMSSVAATVACCILSPGILELGKTLLSMTDLNTITLLSYAAFGVAGSTGACKSPCCGWPGACQHWHYYPLQCAGAFPYNCHHSLCACMHRRGVTLHIRGAAFAFAATKAYWPSLR